MPLLSLCISALSGLLGSWPNHYRLTISSHTAAVLLYLCLLFWHIFGQQLPFFVLTFSSFLACSGWFPLFIHFLRGFRLSNLLLLCCGCSSNYFAFSCANFSRFFSGNVKSKCLLRFPPFVSLIYLTQFDFSAVWFIGSIWCIFISLHGFSYWETKLIYKPWFICNFYVPFLFRIFPFSICVTLPINCLLFVFIFVSVSVLFFERHLFLAWFFINFRISLYNTHNKSAIFFPLRFLIDFNCVCLCGRPATFGIFGWGMMGDLIKFIYLNRNRNYTYAALALAAALPRSHPPPDSH